MESLNERIQSSTFRHQTLSPGAAGAPSVFSCSDSLPTGWHSLSCMSDTVSRAPHVLLPLCSPATRSPAPPPEGTSASPAPATPAAAVPPAPSVTPTVPPEEEDPALSPHLLLPDSLSQLEEFGRQKKWQKRQNKQQRPRQFNDLWVRLEDR